MHRITIITTLLALALVLTAADARAAGEDLSAAPTDVKLVLGTVMLELQHAERPADAAAFDPEGTHLIAEDFAYPGFQPTSVRVLERARLQEAPPAYGLLAAMKLHDTYGRGADLLLSAAYAAQGEDLTMLETLVRRFSPLKPRVEVYFVPMAEVEAAGPGIYDSWPALYEFAKGHDVPKGEGSMEEHQGFVFVMDRLMPAAQVEVYLGDKRFVKRQRNSFCTPVFLDYDGWRVALVAGKLGLDASRSRFYLNVFYTPGPEVAEDQRESERIFQFVSTR